MRRVAAGAPASGGWPGWRLGRKQRPPTAPPIYVVDVATEADYEYVQVFGGSAEANNSEIEGILNVVEGVYQSELLLHAPN